MVKFPFCNLLLAASLLSCIPHEEAAKARKERLVFFEDQPAGVSGKLAQLGGSYQLAKRADSARKFVYILSPISDQVIDVGRQFNPQLNAFNDNVYTRQTVNKESKLITEDRGGITIGQETDECHTIRHTMELVKEEPSKSGNLALRRSCKGLVQVNKCEGWCSSSVRPSIKTQTGFKKNCLCCNEGSLKLVQVRLNECSWIEPTGGSTIRRISKDEPDSFMDVSIEEPSECKCRRCDAGF